MQTHTVSAAGQWATLDQMRQAYKEEISRCRQGVHAAETDDARSCMREQAKAAARLLEAITPHNQGKLL